MNIVEIQSSSEQSTFRSDQQDVVKFGFGKDGTAIMGVFDGHNEYGDVVAEEASGIIDTMIENPIFFQEHFSRKAYLRRLIEGKHNEIYENPSYQRRNLDSSGTTATIGMFGNDKLTVANVGDSEAFFYPDDADGIMMTTRHDMTNPREVRRMKRMGVSTLGHQFFMKGFNVLALSRAIGDINPPFVGQKASVKTIPIHQSGTFVMATDGIWGMDLYVDKNHNYKAYHDYVQALTHTADRSPEGLMTLAHRLTSTLSERTEDNASVIVARIE